MTQAAILAASGSPGTTTGFKNRIINGAMVISQRNGTSSITPANNDYLVDRFLYKSTQASKFTAQQVTTAPGNFTNSLKMTVASAVSVGSGDFFSIGQRIEGLNLYDIGFGTSACKSTSLSFWVRSSLTGTFGGALTNAAGDASYAFTYTISVADTWTYITVTVPPVTTGTWVTDNSSCLQVWFGLGAGSSYSGAAGSWVNGNNFTATGAVSVVGTGSATWYVTGVQLEVGTTATNFDFRSIGTEFQLCQRYYYVMVSGAGSYFATAFYYTSTHLISAINFPVAMRTDPSLVSGSGTNYYQFYRNGTADGLNSLTLSSSGLRSGSLQNQTDVSGTAGQAGALYADNANALIALSAEL